MNVSIRKCLLTALLLMGVGGTSALANVEDTTRGQELTFGHLQLGYSGVESEDDTNVLPFNEQESSPQFDFSTLWVKDGTHVGIDAVVEGNDDYSGNVYLDLHGLIRLNARDEGLYHRLSLLPPLPTLQASDWVTYKDQTTLKTYHFDFRQQDVVVKVAPPLLASHVIAKYRRVVQTGIKAQRYADDDGTATFPIYVIDRVVDQNVVEYAGLLDAHLGAIEVGVEHLQRDFDNNAPPVFSVNSGEHDVVTGNSFKNSTLKAHTSLAGGLVFAASTSLGERKNETELTGVAPVEATTDIYKAATDVTWTPLPLLTMSFRYRITDIDQDAIRAYTTPSLNIAEAMDVTRSSYAGTAVLRVSSSMTLKGGYQHDSIRREHMVDSGFWSLPKNEEVDQYNVDMQYRPFQGSSRLDLGYQFLHSSDPAYAMSHEASHRTKVNFRFNPSPTWGGTIALRGEQGENGGVQFSTSQGEVVFNRADVKRDATVSLWASPWERTSFGGSFGYADARSEQDLYYGQYGAVDVIARDAESKQIVRNLSLFANFAPSKHVTCAFDVHRVRGSYEFVPEFADVIDGTLVVSDSYLGDEGAVEIVQDGLTVGAEWEPVSTWILGVKYSFDRYDDRKGNAIDGTVQSIMGSVAKTW